MSLFCATDRFMNPYYTVVMIICILTMTSLAIDVGKNTILTKGDIKWFRITFILVAIGAACEYTCVTMDDMNRSISWLRKLLTFTEFSISPFLGVLLARSCGMQKTIKPLALTMSVNVILEFISIFNGFIYYIDNAAIYYRGRHYWIYIVFCGISFAYILFVFVIIGIRAKLRSLLNLIIIALIMIIGQAATIIDGTIYSSYLSVCFAATLLYIFIQNMLRHVMIQTINTEKEISNHDALTRVLSRISYDNMISLLDKEIKLSPDKLKFAVCECDLNNLKIINDTFGHDRGDEYIINCCKEICDIFKHSPVYRIGGDEFVAILQNEDYNNLEKLKLIVDETTKREIMKKCTLAEKKSFAAGFSVFNSSKDKSYNDVIKRADVEMYQNKKMLKSL